MMADEQRRDVVVLAGGVGAARFLEGVVQAVDPSRVTAIVNTGDDTESYGLTVSPDVDIVLYTLAGLVEPSQGWGVRGDTYAALEMLERLGRERWFLLGDRDLAVHIHRTELLRQGRTPSEVTDDLRQRLGLAAFPGVFRAPARAGRRAGDPLRRVGDRAAVTRAARRHQRGVGHPHQSE